MCFCLLMFVYLFLAVPLFILWSVNVAFPGDTNLFLFHLVYAILMFSGMLPENNKI